MNDIMHFLETAFGPVVLIFTVSNLASMGLQVNIPPALKTMRNPKFLALVLVCGWVVGPTLGYLITRILPLAEPYAIIVLIMSMAPCAPFLPPMVTKARGDVDFTGAFIPLSMVATVVLMPLLAPFLVKGVTLSASALAKPLVMTVLIPLLVGAVIRTYAAQTAKKIYPLVKGIASLSTLLLVVFALALYGRQMLGTVGSFALLSMTLFMVVMGLIAYCSGFGLKQNQKSVMALGMGTRNIAAVFPAVLAIPNGDPLMTTMVILWAVWSLILAFVAAVILGKQASKATAEGPA